MNLTTKEWDVVLTAVNRSITDLRWDLKKPGLTAQQIEWVKEDLGALLSAREKLNEQRYREGDRL